MPGVIITSDFSPPSSLSLQSGTRALTRSKQLHSRYSLPLQRASGPRTPSAQYRDQPTLEGLREIEIEVVQGLRRRDPIEKGLLT